MRFTMAPLLVHSEAVPPGARSALRAAFAAPEEERDAMLERAAYSLYRETGLDCSDVRELIGLGEGCCNA